MKNRYSVYTGDVMREDLGSSYSFSDFPAELCEYINAKQLKDTRVWSLAVKQFSKTTKSFGIDDADRGWRCEYWGKLMRGACFTFRVTRDEELYSVLSHTVEEMLLTADENGRFSTYSDSCELDGWDIWGRKYIMLGMIYFIDICKSEEQKERILSALIRHADCMLEKLGYEQDGKKNIAKCTRHWDGLNSCSVLEPFVFLYSLTGEKRYLDFAEYIVGFGGTASVNLFDVMYEDLTRIEDLHQRKAYEMMSCFEGLAEYVRIKKDEKYLLALKRFADRVLLEETSVIGCCGCDFECFDGTRYSQFDPAKEQNIMQETCVTVTWMKFCWQILRMFGDVRFADALEASLYNAFVGAILREEEISPEENGGIPLPIDSYSPLRCGKRKRQMGGRKNLTDDGVKYGCCVAIAAAGFGIASFASVARTDDGFCFNLYRSGRVSTSLDGKPVAFLVDTLYPYDGRIAVRVLMEESSVFTVKFRIPSFSDNASVTVCGEEMTVKSGYLPVTREWHNGDTVILSFDTSLKMITPSDVASDTSINDCVCFLGGPLVFAADERCLDTTEGISLPKGESLSLTYKKAQPDIECRAAYSVSLKDESAFILVDYASAGHGKGSPLMAAWIKVK